MREKIYQTLIELTNGRWTSTLLKRFAHSSFSKKLIPTYVKHYQINLEEIEQPIHSYHNLHEFFTRQLKPGVHTINEQENKLVSPVDAVVAEAGLIQADKHFWVKGKSYNLVEMFEDHHLAEKYIEGSFIVLYLSPRDYHRIHAPISGVVTCRKTMGNKSYPVNHLGMTYGKTPLSKNYRVLTEVKNQFGHLAIVKVGAMCINSIELIHENEQIIKGEEMAYFSFGSTVVLLCEKATVQLISRSTPFPVRVGEIIGEFII